MLEPVITQIEKAWGPSTAETLTTLDLNTVKGYLAVMALGEPPVEARGIAQYVSQIIRDGDTLQIGFGMPSVWVITLGAFDNKHDLGIYSEMGSPGFGTLTERGIVTGR